MKSKILSFSAILFSVLLLASCAKLDKVLVKKDGKWKVTRTRIKITSGGIPISDVTNNTPNLTYTFEKDNKGTITDASGTNTPFTWAADDDAETITVVSGGLTTVWNLTENEKKSIKGKSSYSINIFGTVSSYESEIDMERIN